MTTHNSATRNRAGPAGRPGLATEDPRRFKVKGWLLWTAGFVAFPVAGIAAQAAVGRINDAVAALTGGLIAGAVIAAGIGVDSQYAVFGAFGAITFMALSGALLYRLRPATSAADSPSTSRPPRPPSGHLRRCARRPAQVVPSGSQQ